MSLKLNAQIVKHSTYITLVCVVTDHYWKFEQLRQKISLIQTNESSYFKNKYVKLYYPPLSKPIPVPDIILELVPKVEDPKVPGLLNVVLFPVFPNKLPGFCCPNNEEPLFKFKPVFVPA